jgi:tetratricopeptide (TPR) repeat protein
VSCGGDEAEPPGPLPDGAETRSLLGDTLVAPDLTDDFRAKQEGLLAEAREALRSEPDSLDALIWVGRRTAYLGRYREAVAIYTRGMGTHREDPRLYRHRGHRCLTLRKLDDAIDDLERAAVLVEGKPDEIEPDGLPNDRNIPTSTLQSNIWYHLGLAYYCKGDLDNALRAYRECMKVSLNPDMLSATTHWLYMTLRHLGRDAEANAVLEPIHAGMEIIENADYHRLLLMYKGELLPEDVLLGGGEPGSVAAASAAYGVGNWYRLEGDTDRAVEIFEAILAAGQWPAFGHLAAEADLARLGAR